MLTASTAARAPKRLGFSVPAPPETIRTSAAQCRGGFRKKVFGPPFLQGRKWGVRRCVRVEKLISENRVASCIPPFRTFPGVRYGRARHRLFRNRRHGRMHVHRRNASDAHRRACARGRAHGNPHRWRRRWHVWIRSQMQPIAPPRCGCGSGVGYELRKWRRWSMRSILDHGETAAGVCRLPPAVCESFGEL